MIGAIALTLLGQCQSVYTVCGCDGFSAGGAVIDGGALWTPSGRSFAIDAQGRIECSGIAVDAQQYAASFDGGSCVRTLMEAGLTQPPCHDTGCGCSTAPGLGAALLLLLFRRRR